MLNSNQALTLIDAKVENQPQGRAFFTLGVYTWLQCSLCGANVPSLFINILTSNVLAFIISNLGPYNKPKMLKRWIGEAPGCGFHGENESFAFTYCCILQKSFQLDSPPILDHSIIIKLASSCSSCSSNGEGDPCSSFFLAPQLCTAT
jgi:hypothetical protein